MRPRPLYCTDKEVQCVLIKWPVECTDNKTPCADNRAHETLVQCFLTFFWFMAPFETKNNWRHPYLAKKDNL